MRKDKLSLLVFLVLDEYLYSVANLQVGIVAEFAKRNDSVRLVANVNHYLTLVECDNGTFGYIFVLNSVQRLVVGLFQFLKRFASLSVTLLIGFPIEVFNG